MWSDSAPSEYTLSPVSQNMLVAKNIYLGPDYDPEILQDSNITLMFTFYGGVLVHNVLSDGSLGIVQHCGLNEDLNYLRYFLRLCTAIERTMSKGENVLLYVRDDDEHRPECTSRVYTLEEAWRIWAGHGKMKERGADRGKILEHHKEQLRVWEAMGEAQHGPQADVIYDGWRRDFESGRSWSGKGLPTFDRVVQQFRRIM